MKKRIFLLLLCLALLLTGCAASRRTPKQTFRIYGLSGAPGGDAISAVDVDWSERKSLTVDQQAQAALEQLLGACTEPGYRTPIPQGVTLRSCQLTGGMALVDFSQGYEQLSGIDLTIADYCVTLTSEDDVTRTLGVRLFFPARESGLLTSESRTLTLHEGDSAVEAIMSALMEGPQTESLSPLLPEGFQMLTVRVESGTCYLNLPRSDVSLLPEGLEAQQLLVRGLVNSLCSANGVDRVQLLLDGQVAASFGQVDISGPLYRE